MAIEDALANGYHVRLVSSLSSSVALVKFWKRGEKSVSLGVTDEKYVRITQNSRVDTNGARQGPWTEFALDIKPDGLLTLLGVKSHKWLTIVNGEFHSSDKPEMLTVEVSRTRSWRAEEVENAGRVNLHLVGSSRTLPWVLQICRELQSNIVFLRTLEGNVACGQNASSNGWRCRSAGKEGIWAQWEIEHTDAGDSFKNVGHGKYLSVGPDGVACLLDEPSYFRPSAAEEGDPAVPAASLTAIDSSVLSQEDRVHFREHGYIILKNGVEQHLVRDALRTINHQLGTPGCWQADSDPLNAGQLVLNLSHGAKQTFQDILNQSPRFWSAINILLGSGNVEPWKGGTQVALRFPQAPEKGFDVPDVKPGTRYHIDGMGQNRLCPFSLLCGVALSEQLHENMGNLHVFPGSHLNKELQRYYVERINDDNQNESDESKPDLGSSVQVLLKPGDVVIAHQLLAHRVGVNTSEHIRYQLYYRVSHRAHADLKSKVVDDPWTEFAI